MFRYATKLEDTGSLDESIETASLGDFDDDEEDEELLTPNQQYSVFCGLSRFFGRRQAMKKEERAIVEAAASFIVDGFHENGKLGQGDFQVSNGSMPSHLPATATRSNEFSKDENVASVATRYLVATALSRNSGSNNWVGAVMIAAVLIGDSDTRFRRLSPLGLSNLIKATTARHLEHLISAGMPRNSGPTRTLAKCISQCNSQIDQAQASLLFDFALILLHRVLRWKGYKADPVGLLLVAVVVGHTANRITDILSKDEDGSPLMSLYLDAKFELDRTKNSQEN